jgi:acetylornithine deacetylase/succinyl-diaminopimelate desuccinylase-like protein
MSHSLYENLDHYINSSRNEFENILKQFVEIPSVSLDPEKKNDMRRQAELAKTTLEKFGARADIVETSGNPIVVGQMIKNSSFPTVTIYNHLDVQPAGEPEWTREPFRFDKQGDTYFGRGSTDDKGPGLTALFGARYAIQNNIPINIKFLWELEEEIGSPNFEQGVTTARAMLDTDSVLVSDTIWVDRNKPAISYGLRGLQAVLLRLETGTKDVHSGLTGGAARNPIGEICDLISKMYDAKTGKIKIPGFYKDVQKPSAAEIKSMLSSGFNTKKFMQDHGFKSIRYKSPKDITLRIWAYPTLEVHGISGGYQGAGVKTIVPPRAEAKLSFRIVPDQTPKKVFTIVKAFAKKQNPDIEVISGHSLASYSGQFSGPYAEAAREALHFATGIVPAFVREGGSIGAVVSMQNLLNAPVMFIGLSLPEHGYHAPNENYDWGQASRGMKAFVKYFDIISGYKKK